MDTNTESPLATKKRFLFIFDLEKDAATPWQVRRRKAAICTGFLWGAVFLGIFFVKYGLKVTDDPVSTLILKSAVIALVFFLIIIFAYWQNDVNCAQRRRLDEKYHRR